MEVGAQRSNAWRTEQQQQPQPQKMMMMMMLMREESDHEPIGPGPAEGLAEQGLSW